MASEWEKKQKEWYDFKGYSRLWGDLEPPLRPRLTPEAIEEWNFHSRQYHVRWSRKFKGSRPHGVVDFLLMRKRVLYILDRMHKKGEEWTIS